MFTAIATSLAGCASHKNEVLIPWTKSIHTNPHKICEARFLLRANAEDEQIVSDAFLRFELQGDYSRAELKILNSLFMTVARLNLAPNEVRWEDQDGEKEIKNHPLFQRWFQPEWWQEFAFVFGMPLKETWSATMKNQNGQAVMLQKATRKIYCSYESNAVYPSSCTIEDSSFSAKLNFTSADCRSPI